MPDHTYNISWNGYEKTDPPIELTISDADIDAVVAEIPPDPIRTPASWPLIGDLAIIDDPPAKARTMLQAIQQNPLNPDVTIEFKCQGECPPSLNNVSIDKMSVTPDHHRYNFKAFGMGVSLTFDPVVSKGICRVGAFGCPSGQERKIQEFKLDWKLSYNVTPGPGGNVDLKTEMIEVWTPCCRVAGSENEEEGESGGGW